jgi:uncharacterized cupredoxin-like copper-binding protein
LIGSAATGASAQTKTFIPTVVMTITDTTLDFRPTSGLAPGTVPDGKVSFKLDNKARGWRSLTIQNKSTRRIGSGKSSTLTVSLPGAGEYYYSVDAQNVDSTVNGIVTAVDVCTHPQKSNVVVKLLEGPLVSSPEHVHCGTVTFILKNTEKSDDSFQVSLPGTTQPAPESPTGEIKPGKTLRLTVHYRFKGIVSFGSNEPFRNTEYNEFGALAIV